MAYLSYIKLMESEFDNIVFKKDKVQDMNNNQLKLEVHESYRKYRKLPANFEPVNIDDVINETYLDEKLKKQTVIFHK